MKTHHASDRLDANVLDVASIAFVALLFLVTCGACATHAALFVPPRPTPPERLRTPAPEPDDTLDELARFPGPEETRLAIQWIEGHRKWLAARLECCTAEEWCYWSDRAGDMWWRWDVWTDLRVAHGCTTPGSRRTMLDTLRRKFRNDEAYERGQMPAVAPGWLFLRTD